MFVLDLIARGPLYAIANYRIHAPSPLDAVENWEFWTQPRAALLEWCLKNYPPLTARKAYLDATIDRDAAIGIEAHYDISNDFYALFLDTKYRFYTCADFSSEQTTLEAAQKQKAACILSLLNLRGSEKILDLGCGWGAMLRFLQDAGHQGELTGLTLSKKQFSYARNELGLNVSLANFVTDPFENAPYDRIFSIGSLEHVRPQEIENLYQKIYQALIPGGLSVHQFFSLETEPYPASMVMIQLFFPGSLLVMHRHHIDAAKKAGFRIVSDSIGDYKPTLRAWYERLVKNKEQAIELVGLEIYNRYMTFFPIAWRFFQEQEAALHRVVMEKPSC